MSLDGKLLYNAKARLEEKRKAKAAENIRRTEEVYRANPKVRNIDIQLKSLVMDAIGQAISRGADPEGAVDALRDESMYLQEERAKEIAAAGFPADYLDSEYNCPKCRDTGYDGTRLCSCLMELYREEQVRDLSKLLNIGSDTFDNFNLDWYSDEADPKLGISPRSNMEIVYEICVSYARRFGSSSPNLFMHGGTGLGKTFLSTCIAKVVSENGFSVVYDTAGSVFSKFEEEKFSRAADPDEVRSDIRRYMTCDLLILDDLGTEMTTSFTVSALYSLINTRITSGKKTVISTNLSPDEIYRRYSPQIASRLEGEFQVLPFYGRDIRILKKEV